jgi:hypothetical protein
MSLVSFTKEEYQALLNVLHRVEVKGLSEAQALLHLGSKLDAHIKAEATEVVSDVKQVTGSIDKA